MYKFIKKLYNKFVIAEIAPTVEQLSRNQWVAGSNPVFSTIFDKYSFFSSNIKTTLN